MNIGSVVTTWTSLEGYTGNHNVLHLKTGDEESETALEMAEVCKKTDVAKLLRGMMVLPKEGKAGGEKKAATKGGKA